MGEHSVNPIPVMQRFLLALILVAASSVAFAPDAFGQSGEDLFQQALRTERLSGNMEAAIALYEQIVEEHGDDRELSANALLQLARAYEALGRTEARRAYGRLLNDYPDYPQVVVEARAGYERTREPVAEAATKQEPLSRTAVQVPEWFNRWDSSVSPSGRYLVGASWRSAQSPGVGLLDIQTGEEHVFPLQIEPEVEGWNPRMSPDESRIVLSWLLSQWSTDLVLVDVESGEYELIFDSSRYYREERGIDVEDASVRPHQWSADGNRILLNTAFRARGQNRSEGGEELGIFDLTSGTFQVFAAGEQTNGYAWEKMCWSADERYVFADFWEMGDLQSPSLDERLNEYIRRFDTQTGEAIDWRRQEGADFSLASCDWTREEVVYVATGVASRLLRSASFTDIDFRDDPVLSRLHEDDRMALGNAQGDLVSWRESFATTFVAQVDLSTGTLTGPSKRIAQNFRPATWSPEGDELLLHRGTGVTIWSEDGETRTIKGMPSGRSAYWLADGNVYYYEPARNAAEDWTQNFDVHVLNRATGEATLVLSAEHANEMGVRFRLAREHGIANVWNSERQCLQRLDLESRELSDWACFEPGYFKVANSFQLGPTLLNEAPEGSRNYVFRAPRADGLLDIGVLNTEEDAPRVVTIDPRNENGQELEYRARPLPDGRLLLYTQGDGEIIESLDLDTGERTPMFGELLNQMSVRHLNVHPQGNQVAVVGYPKGAESEAGTVTVIHSVLGDR